RVRREAAAEGQELAGSHRAILGASLDPRQRLGQGRLPGQLPPVDEPGDQPRRHRLGAPAGVGGGGEPDPRLLAGLAAAPRPPPAAWRAARPPAAPAPTTRSPRTTAAARAGR